jgi:hypothetical protein
MGGGGRKEFAIIFNPQLLGKSETRIQIQVGLTPSYTGVSRLPYEPA